MAAASASASSSAAIRTWRTAFLTLRDETSTSSPKWESIGQLLQDLILSQSPSLLSAASDLPSHELTSDLLFLLELSANSPQQHFQDYIPIFSTISHLMHDICQRQRISLQINSSSWTIILQSYGKILQILLGKPTPPAAAAAAAASLASSYTPTTRPAMDCILTLRHLVNIYRHKSSLPDNIQLVNFLLRVVESSSLHLLSSSHTGTSQKSASATSKRLSRCNNLWQVHTIALTMLGEAFARIGSSFPPDIWQSTIEVLRKVMDVLAAKNFLVEDIIMSRFYASLLNCLHLVLIDCKGSISDHVSAFVAALRMFLVYGLATRMQPAGSAYDHCGKELPLTSLKLTSEEPVTKNCAPYRPPHLRKKDSSNMKWSTAQDSHCSSDQECSASDFMSSDSECSDNDGSGRENDSFQSSKVRVGAICCVQDLCQADPKSLTSQWTMLLPINDILQPRRFEANLMTCLVFDPSLKARIASASTLAAMLDGPSSVFLQVAEYKKSTKWGSYMPLSSSLGQILMQLHNGILYLIQHETHSRLLPSLFKILTLLISSTPYPRMPEQLLPKVLTSLLAKTENGFSLKGDQIGLLATTFNCLTTALSTSPSSPQVRHILLEEISTGSVEAEKRTGVLSVLFQYSEQLTSPTICFEALQALRALTHNYPDIGAACWGKIFNIVSKILSVAASEVPMRTWKANVGDNVGYIGEKVITAAVKVLDKCLRAVSGFKGTEDLPDDQLLDTPFASDCRRPKKVSSAPSYEPDVVEYTKEEQQAFHSGSEPWSKAIEEHIPFTLWHTSSMVRTASVTCFAGITSSMFFCLTKENQEFIVSSLANAAVHDEVPSVRSAACRAIGVVSCFQQISQRAEILDKFIRAVEINTRDPLVSVRITASWALANICESLRHCMDDSSLQIFTDSDADSQSITLLTECALHLTNDGDKVKSNAVRALGNLARIINFMSSSGVHDNTANHLDTLINNIKVLPGRSNLQDGDGHASKTYHKILSGDPCLVERIVQAFLSCITTGNVKVQWNACHALSNLFLNETLRPQNKEWAPSVFSVLLLLLRDSSNFKIRIQAATALAVPTSVIDYGKCFSDVVQGLQHVLENIGSGQNSSPSCFRYRAALEKQITSTMLHVLNLASNADSQILNDFLVKKAPFLEEWFNVLCSSLGGTNTWTEAGSSLEDQKKQMVSKAIQSVIEVFKSRNHHGIAQKFETLDGCLK